MHYAFISDSSSVTCCSLHPRFYGEIHFDGDLMSCEQSREGTGAWALTGVWSPVPGAVDRCTDTEQASGERSVQSRYTSQR